MSVKMASALPKIKSVSLYITIMASNLSQNITQGLETGIQQPGMIQQQEHIRETVGYTTGLENAAAQFSQIITVMFIANFLMIFTGRLLTREDPYKIKVLGQELYELPSLNIEDKWIAKLDRMLFALNFTLVSFLMALNKVGYGYFTEKGGS
jgi:hypothetical protein